MRRENKKIGPQITQIYTGSFSSLLLFSTSYHLSVAGGITK